MMVPWVTSGANRDVEKRSRVANESDLIDVEVMRGGGNWLVLIRF